MLTNTSLEVFVGFERKWPPREVVLSGGMALLKWMWPFWRKCVTVEASFEVTYAQVTCSVSVHFLLPSDQDTAPSPVWAPSPAPCLPPTSPHHNDNRLNLWTVSHPNYMFSFTGVIMVMVSILSNRNPKNILCLWPKPQHYISLASLLNFLVILHSVCGICIFLDIKKHTSQDWWSIASIPGKKGSSNIRVQGQPQLHSKVKVSLTYTRPISIESISMWYTCGKSTNTWE